MKQSAAEIENPNIKRDINKIKEGASKPFPKKSVLWIKQPKQVEQQVTPTIQNLMLTYHIGVKQSAVKRKILESISVGEKLMLRLQTKKWKGEAVKWKRLKYLSIAETITLIS